MILNTKKWEIKLVAVQQNKVYVNTIINFSAKVFADNFNQYSKLLLKFKCQTNLSI